jgi:hypothetical protein
VPEGSTTTLELLRAATNGAPVPAENLEAMVLSIINAEGFGTTVVEKDDLVVVPNAARFDFGSGLAASEGPAGEANISLIAQALSWLTDVADSFANLAAGQHFAYLGGEWKNADMLRVVIASGPPVTVSSSAGLGTAHQTTRVLPAGTWEVSVFAAATIFNSVVASNNCAFQIGAPVLGTTSYTNGAFANDVHASVAAAQTTIVSNGVAATTFRSEFAPVSGTMNVASGALVALCRRTA